MTWLWVLLWVGLSTIILGAFAWSAIILRRQKNAWKALAEKHNLNFEARRMMDSAVVSGKYGDYFMLCFSDMRDPQDVKARRYVSILELKHAAPSDIEVAAGTAMMVPFMEGLAKLSSVTLDHKDWQSDFHFYAADHGTALSFWDEKRLKHLVKILSVKNADVVMRHVDGNIIVRIETPDPIQQIEKAEQVIGYLTKHIDAVLGKEQKKVVSEPVKSSGDKKKAKEKAVPDADEGSDKA